MQVCYPCFDTRFYRQPELEQQIEPGWLFRDPPRYPGVKQVGGLGAVLKPIPPPPYASCTVGRLVELVAEIETRHAFPPPEMTAIADPFGHVRLRIDLTIAAPPEEELAAVLKRVLTAPIAVRHPERRGQYSTLAEAADDLADCYGRETARTAPAPRGAYKLDWVRAGRPFVVVMAEGRERIAVSGMTVDGPVVDKLFDGHLRFVPWTADGLALPVWLLVVYRGGNAWRPVADTLETFTSHYEEYVVCLQLIESGTLQPAADSDIAVRLERYLRNRRGYLGRDSRAGLALPKILHLLADFDTSTLAGRARHDPRIEATIHERVAAVLQQSITVAGNGPTIAVRIGTMTLNVSGTGNIVNLGQMIANTISTTNTVLNQSSAAPDLKNKLEELRDPIAKAAEKLGPEEAKELLEDYESFVKQALRKTPDKAVVQSQGNAIVNAVAKIAEYAAPVATIVTAVTKLLGF